MDFFMSPDLSSAGIFHRFIRQAARLYFCRLHGDWQLRHMVISKPVTSGSNGLSSAPRKFRQQSERSPSSQISDVHLGLIVRQSRLKRIIARINEASPDLLVSTGDLVDGQINRMTGLAELLQDIRPKFGKFAVTGNHEIYAGLDQAIDFTERAGFKVLRNEASPAGELINVVGSRRPGDRKDQPFQGSP